MVNKNQLKALLFATTAHGLQTRKYSGDFYIVHPLEVRQILVEHGCEDEEMLMAALLHDVIEDTPFTREDIINDFGPAVTELVVELSEVLVEGNRAFRKAAERDRLALVSSRAQMVKCADFISNTRDIFNRDKGFARKYLQEKRECLMVFSEVTKQSSVYKTAWEQVERLSKEL